MAAGRVVAIQKDKSEKASKRKTPKAPTTKTPKPKKKMDDAYFDDLISSSYSKSTTAGNYANRLKSLKAICDGQQTVLAILSDPDGSYGRIRDKAPNVNTRKNYLTLVLALFKNSEDLRLALPQQHARWRAFHDRMDGFQESKYRKHLPDQKQLMQYTSMEEIRAKYEELRAAKDPHGTLQKSQELLLLSIATHLPPKRSDYGAMKVFYDSEKFEDQKNILVLVSNPPGRPSYMSFGKYKAKGQPRRFDQDLPHAATRDIRDSLRRHPREYLFVNRFGAPFGTNDAFGKFFKRTFQNLFGRDTGTSMLRHIYITEKVNYEELDEDQKDDIAQHMLHSTRLQNKYKWNRGAICGMLKQMCGECSATESKKQE